MSEDEIAVLVAVAIDTRDWTPLAPMRPALRRAALALVEVGTLEADDARERVRATYWGRQAHQALKEGAMLEGSS